MAALRRAPVQRARGKSEHGELYFSHLLLFFRAMGGSREKKSTPRFPFALRAPLARPAASSSRRPPSSLAVLLHSAAVEGRELEPFCSFVKLTLSCPAKKKKKKSPEPFFFHPSTLSSRLPSMGDDHGPAVGEDFKYSTGLTTAGEYSLERGSES